MNYLGRTIFPFSIDWATAIQRSVTFDLREILIGFGAERFQPTQQFTVNGWDCSIVLQTGADILSFESFADALLGRLNGFWLPCPIEAAQFVAGVSTTQFDVVAEDLASSWNARPDQHLLLIYPNGTQRAGLIQGVAAVGGNERVTLTIALPEIPPAGTIIKRLHYVRFSNDTEPAKFITENAQSVAISVVELPLEYTNVQTGLQPIYLYHFWTGAPAQFDWRYTSFAASVVSQNQLYTAFPITHGSLQSSAKPDAQTLEIDAVYDASHPFSMFLPLPPQRQLNVEVFEINYGDLDTQTTLFTGWVRQVDDDGEQLKATCDSWQNILQRKLPRMHIQPTCNYDVYDPNTCKVLRAQFETTAKIVSIDSAAFPPTVTVDLLFPGLAGFNNWITEDWFAEGFLETGFGVDFEMRTILSSILPDSINPGRLVLELNAPLNNAVVGQFMQLIPGCDGLASTCLNKFNAFDNFGGFIAVPTRNLSLKAVNAAVSQGGKK